MPQALYEKAQLPITDRPELPRVLLIGDSVSIGYTLAVREALDGVANVHRPAINCASSVRGLQGLDKWLGKKKWDVIHFNWGLHDLRYDKGKQNVPLAEYKANLRLLVARLKETGAKLVWASITPVPVGSSGRSPEDVLAYNAVAAGIMKENGIPTNDLYALALPRLAKIQLPKNAHFTMDGSEVLSAQVAASILKALAEEKTD